MERWQLEHLIRAASAIADDYELVVIGSQAILGSIPDAAPELLVSMEADIYPLNRPERADLIDGSIGEGSPFEQEFGYYAQGVSPETSVLPEGWQQRLVRVQNENTRSAIGYCIGLDDLALSKYVANRPKDREFIRELLRQRYVDPEKLLAMAPLLPVEVGQLAEIQAAIKGDRALIDQAITR